MLISGSHVTLRSLTNDDEAKFIEAVSASRDINYPWASPPDTKEAYKNFINNLESASGKSFVVTLKKSDAFIGVINLSNIIRGCFQNAFLGYYRLTPSSKKGLMTEAISLVIIYAFFHLKLHRLEANVQPENIQSINLLERLGFVQEGLAKNYLNINGYWQDHIRFGLTLECAQEFWLKKAQDKAAPWLPDFELTALQLKEYLKENDNRFRSIQSVRHLDYGWDNDVYCVDERYIFRCPRRNIALSLIQRENVALDFLHHKLPLLVPHPKYQYLGPDFYPYPFHGYVKLEGAPMHLANLTRQDRVNNIAIFAKFLKALHIIPTREALNAGLSLQVFDRTRKEHVFKQVMARIEKDFFKAYQDDFAKDISALSKKALDVELDKTDSLVIVHGDLYAKHFLVKDKCVVAVIDWGDVGLNHPVVDLAALFLLFPKSAHHKFYEIYGLLEEDVIIYAKFLAVHSALACLEFATEHEDLAFKQESMSALRFIFE